MPVPSSPPLRALVANLVNVAFDAIGDLNQQATYRRPGQVYNPATGTMTANNIDTVLSRCVFSRFGTNEIDDKINIATDSKVLIPAAQIPFSPFITDLILTPDGTVYNVIRDLTVPGQSLLILHVREG